MNRCHKDGPCGRGTAKGYPACVRNRFSVNILFGLIVVMSCAGLGLGAGGTGEDKPFDRFRYYSVDPNTGRLIDSMPTTIRFNGGEPKALVFYPDGRTLATLTELGVTLWDFDTGKMRFRNSNGSGHYLARSANGKQLTTVGSYNGPRKDGQLQAAVITLSTIDLHEQAPPGLGPFQFDDQLAFSADRRIVAVHSIDRNSRPVIVRPEDVTVVLHDAFTWKVRHRLVAAQPIKSMAFSPSELLLATVGGGMIYLEANAKYKDWRDGVWFIDGKQIPRPNTPVPEVLLWDAASGKVKQRLLGPKCNVECVAISPDGRMVGAGDEHGTIWLWEAATGKRIASWHNEPEGRSAEREWANIRHIAFSPDNKMLVTAVSQGRSMLWSLTDKGPRSHRVLLDFPSWMRASGIPLSAAFSPDGRYVAIGVRPPGMGNKYGEVIGRGGIYIWDIASGKEYRPWEKKAK